MITIKKLFTVSICVVLILSGCDQAGIETSQRGVDSESKASAGFLNIVKDEYHYFFSVCQSAGETWGSDGTDTVNHSFRTDQMAQSYLWRKGRLTFAGVNIPNVDPTTSSYHGTISNMLLNGSTQYFAVTDNPSSGSWTVGVTSPLHQVEISSPVNRERITKTAGITVTWTQAEDRTQLVAIHVFPASGTVAPIFIETTDDGSYTFSGDDLLSLPTGRYDVVIQRGNLVTGKAPDGKDYVAVLYTQDQHRIILQ